MKQSTAFKIRGIALVIYSLFIFIYVKVAIQPELIYHQQQTPFNSNFQFFNHYLLYPGGPAEYISSVISQFFYYGWAGSLIITLVGLLIAFASFSIFNSIKKADSNYFWMFLPFILLITLLNDYFFPFDIAIKILIVLGSLAMLNLFSGKYLYYFICLFLVMPLVYYFTGSGFMMIFSLSALLLILNNNRKLILKLVTGLVIVLYAYVVCVIAFKFIFSVSPANKFFALLPYFIPDFYLSYNSNRLFYIFCNSMPGILFLFLLKYKVYDMLFKQKPPILKRISNSFGYFNYLIISLFILGVSYFTIRTTFDVHKKNIVLSDFYCSHEQWNDVILIATKDQEYDISINFNYNRAIDNTGNFLDRFFAYPQYMGEDVLFPDLMKNPQLALISSDFYYDMGYITESLHWANESAIFNSYGVRNLERLIMDHLILGNYEGARKYLAVLDGNFIAHDFVRKYQPYVEDTSLAGKDPVFREKRSYTPDVYHLVDAENRFYDLINKNNNNKRAYEHLQLCYLLKLNLGKFIQNIKPACKFYNEVPRIYQEAEIYFSVITDVKKLKDYPINKDILQSFEDFSKLKSENKIDLQGSKDLFTDFVNTYMYYVNFNSPQVTNMKLIRIKEFEYH